MPQPYDVIAVPSELGHGVAQRSLGSEQASLDRTHGGDAGEHLRDGEQRVDSIRRHLPEGVEREDAVRVGDAEHRGGQSFRGDVVADSGERGVECHHSTSWPRSGRARKRAVASVAPSSSTITTSLRPLRVTGPGT